MMYIFLYALIDAEKTSHQNFAFLGIISVEQRRTGSFWFFPVLWFELSCTIFPIKIWLVLL